MKKDTLQVGTSFEKEYETPLVLSSKINVIFQAVKGIYLIDCPKLPPAVFFMFI